MERCLTNLQQERVQGLKKLILFSGVEKGKDKPFSEGKKLILFSDVEKGKGKSFSISEG